MFCLQYLEDGPGVRDLAPSAVGTHLRAALERLPISAVLLGWNLPDGLVAACREEAVRAGARLLRWHPLLTGDGALRPAAAWLTIGVDGKPVPGFKGMPEFTFLCPNRPAVQDAVLHHLDVLVRSGAYDGVFLDRIRYPSPAADPSRWLACFCYDCQRVAATEGLDMEVLRRAIGPLQATPERIAPFLQVLLDPSPADGGDANLAALRAFLDLRAQSVTRLVARAATLITAAGLEVGLDCFTPALTRMVGQDLQALSMHCAWIKVMSYGHTLGPAGLPFELLALADWLVAGCSTGEAEALAWLSRATRLQLPASREALRRKGLSPQALGAEVERGRRSAGVPLLAGVELVQIAQVAELEEAQICADLTALRDAGADGLVLSWDLWHIPLERLDLVRAVWT